MADMGSGAHARTVNALPRDRELLAGGASTGAGEEEDNTDAATDEEVEREGVALAAAVGAEHDEHLVEAGEDAAAGDKLRRGVDGGGCGRLRRAPTWDMDDEGCGR
uniref:DUF834 domain-containing protein n=1 Tax=Oryza glumipatula TaxID=40148 RepID=A0A0D9YZ18_9ORYZ